MEFRAPPFGVCVMVGARRPIRGGRAHSDRNLQTPHRSRRLRRGASCRSTLHPPRSPRRTRARAWRACAPPARGCARAPRGPADAGGMKAPRASRRGPRSGCQPGNSAFDQWQESCVACPHNRMGVRGRSWVLRLPPRGRFQLRGQELNLPDERPSTGREPPWRRQAVVAAIQAALEPAS